MKKWAVSYLNFFDNEFELLLKVVEAESERDALEAAFPGLAENVRWDNLETAKDDAFNQDWLFEIVEIT
jgi:hypothetical protein